MKPIFDFLLKTCILAILFWMTITITGFLQQVDSRSVFFAWIISLLNSVIGYALYEYAYHKNNSEFYTYVLGGHGVRALLVLICIALLVITNTVSRLDFFLSFVALYFIHLIIEILAYQKKNQFEKRSLQTSK